MHKTLIPVALLGAFLSAQQASRTFPVPGTTTQTKTVVVDGVTFSAVSRDAGRTWTRLAPVDTDLHIRFGTFDPRHPTVVPGKLVAGADSRLFVVQFHTQIIPEFRARLQGMGAQIHHYLPSQSYLVRMDPGLCGAIGKLPFVRCVANYELAYRLEPEIIAELGEGGSTATRYVIVLVDKRRDALGLENRIVAAGGQLNLRADGGILLEATLTERQLLTIVADDRVLWIQRSSKPEVDIDNARIQGGTNYVETQAGIDGKGMSGHIMEGVYATHVEFAAIAPYRLAPFIYKNKTPDGHGTNTAGEIYARGARKDARGIMPFAQMTYTNYSYVYNTSTRYSLTKDITSPARKNKCMLQTASWGYARTRVYDARSAEMDDIIHDHDFFVTQSQSNAGNQDSRPQAWAKNICSVGGFRHGDNSSAADDYWGRTGSTGPASDGRIGVTLAAYYDSILTTSGTSGYTTGFGGTSGATPIINGLGGNVIEMFTDGLFGYGKTPKWDQRFNFLPHFTTTKSLLIASAKQIPFDKTTTGVSKGATRYQQGWGFPNLKTLYDNRNKMLVIDELDVLEQGKERTYFLWVPAGVVRFVAAMNHADPEAAALAKIHRINSVDLKVVAADGTVYWGNHGLLRNMESKPIKQLPYDLDTEECVQLKSPPTGLTEVTVKAVAVRKDAHVETAAVDLDYALVVRGVGGLRDKTASDTHPDLTLASATAGGLSVTLTDLPATGWAQGFTLFSLDTTRPLSTGNALGLELDGVALSILSMPAALGSVFHFTPPGASKVFPNTSHDFPAPIAGALKGRTLDGVSLLLDGKAAVVRVSNVSRVTVR